MGSWIIDVGGTGYSHGKRIYTSRDVGVTHYLAPKSICNRNTQDVLRRQLKRHAGVGLRLPRGCQLFHFEFGFADGLCVVCIRRFV